MIIIIIAKISGIEIILSAFQIRDKRNKRNYNDHLLVKFTDNINMDVIERWWKASN